MARRQSKDQQRAAVVAAARQLHRANQILANVTETLALVIEELIDEVKEEIEEREGTVRPIRRHHRKDPDE